MHQTHVQSSPPFLCAQFPHPLIHSSESSKRDSMSQPAPAATAAAAFAQSASVPVDVSRADASSVTSSSSSSFTPSLSFEGMCAFNFQRQWISEEESAALISAMRLLETYNHSLAGYHQLTVEYGSQSPMLLAAGLDDAALVAFWTSETRRSEKGTIGMVALRTHWMNQIRQRLPQLVYSSMIDRGLFDDESSIDLHIAEVGNELINKLRTVAEMTNPQPNSPPEEELNDVETPSSEAVLSARLFRHGRGRGDYVDHKDTPKQAHDWIDRGLFDDESSIDLRIAEVGNELINKLRTVAEMTNPQPNSPPEEELKDVEPPSSEAVLTARLFNDEWGRGGYGKRDDTSKQAHEWLLPLRPQSLKSLETDIIISLKDLQQISGIREVGSNSSSNSDTLAPWPVLRKLHCGLPVSDLLPHLRLQTTEDVRSSVLSALDSAEMIPDLAALCAEYVTSGAAADAFCDVRFLSPQLTDLSLLIRELEYGRDNQYHLVQITTAVIRSMHDLPHLTSLKLDIMPSGYSEGPIDSLPGFEWSLVGALSSLRSLTLHSTCCDPDYGVWPIWNESEAIDSLRQLTHLTALDVTGFFRSDAASEERMQRFMPRDAEAGDFDDDGQRFDEAIYCYCKYAFDIELFARLPVVHASLTDLRIHGGSFDNFSWRAEDCVAFRRLPKLLLINGMPTEDALNDARKKPVHPE